jgi:hypothetical protein
MEVVPFMSQILVSPVLKFCHRRSEKPSPLKSTGADGPTTIVWLAGWLAMSALTRPLTFNTAPLLVAEPAELLATTV